MYKSASPQIHYLEWPVVLT